MNCVQSSAAVEAFEPNLTCFTDSPELNILNTSRKQVLTGLKIRKSSYVRNVFASHARYYTGRFAPLRPCSCLEPLIHGKEFLRPALEMLKISVRNDNEFEELYREVTRSIDLFQI